MILSLVLIIYRSNSPIAQEASKFCKEVLQANNIKSKRIESDFDKDDITFGNATFTGDINLDEITCRNANVTGVATVTSALYVNGKLHDGDGDFGTAGQLLSSDGTDTVWIDASSTSVANANNVGTNVNATNADQFITFVENSSGNNPIRVDAGI